MERKYIGACISTYQYLSSETTYYISTSPQSSLIIYAPPINLASACYEANT